MAELELQACFRELLSGQQPGEALGPALQQEQEPRCRLALDLPDGLSLLHAAVLGGVSRALPALLAAGAEVRSPGRDVEGATGQAGAPRGVEPPAAHCRCSSAHASPSPSPTGRLPRPRLARAPRRVQ